MNILVQVTGSISVYKVCEVVSKLTKLGHKVRVCASHSSLKFVGSATWEALTGERVFSDDFSPGQRMDHINLNKWADLTVLAPASAKTLNQLNYGVGDGVINTLFLARDDKKPFLVFPAMNPSMWKASSVTKSVLELKKQKNIHVFEPNSGLMACGDVGVGRLLEPVDIVSECLRFMPLKKKALVTFGGTFESIDGVREISNFSTGDTGIRLVEELSRDFHVTSIYSEKIKNSFSCSKKITFNSSNDLEAKLKKELGSSHYDMAFHLAAVSDYVPKNKVNTKIDSSGKEISLEFEKRSKLLDEFKNWSCNKDIIVTSFKLTHNQSDLDIEKKINKQISETPSDFVVHNTLGGSRGEEHAYTIFSNKEKKPIFEGDTKTKLVSHLSNLAFFEENKTEGELEC